MTHSIRKLKVPDDIAHFIRTMHPDLKKKIRAGLGIILTNTAGGKALKDELAGLRSFRVSRFRIIYREGRNVIEIVAIGPRERIYEETYRLLKKERK
ncbi:MAG: type II toxin-antitoxin system RelE/ParE family toxin [Nitrospirae bacterium]|nr:type II toxin-antitoxin system RelE/ParE family toxin [Nitrospirota bacterium]